LTSVLSDKTIGIAQAKILLYRKNGERVINSIGNKLHFLGFGFTDGYNLVDTNNIYNTNISGYASGCSLAIRSDIFSQIGGYNEEYYMYHDDVELSAKVRAIGKKIVLVNKSELAHKYEFSRSARMVYYMERNRGIFIFSFYPIKLVILLLPALVISEIFILLASLFGGWFKEKLMVYKYFFQISSWKKIIRSRKSNNSPELIKWILSFSGSLNFQEIDGLLLKIANPLMNLYWRAVKLFFR
jgi:GT2 family glycosyltransferase